MRTCKNSGTLIYLQHNYFKMTLEVRLLACKWMLYAYNLFGLVAGFVYNPVIENSPNRWDLQ